MKKIMGIFCFYLFCSLVTLANASIQPLIEAHKKLEQSLVEVEKSQGEEQLFLEAILRRKNIHLRSQIAEELDIAEESPDLDSVLKAQTRLLVNLVEFGEKEVVELAKKTRATEGEEKIQAGLLLQSRIDSMDTYYQQLTETLSWDKERQIDVSAEEELLKEALVLRADFLTNAILYVNALKKDIKRRLTFVGDETKALLTEQFAGLEEQDSMMGASLADTVSLMKEFSLDVTEYKQLLLVTTGKINTDVLDIAVIWDLVQKWGMSLSKSLLANLPSILLKLCVFCIILYLTRLAAHGISKAVGRSVAHSKMRLSVLMQEFFVSIMSKAVTLLGVFIALSQIGIELGPLLTGFGVAGVIIGFALQDTLSNFASGLMILVYRPYDVKDLVKVAGIMGTVKRMSLVSTTIQTVDNQRLVIPNNKIWGDVINNITAEKIRRVDMVFGIGYADDIDKAKAILQAILEEHPDVLPKPEPVVRLHTLNSSSVDFVVRPWVETNDYWEVYWEITETVKKRFDQEGVSIPFPQRDVHLYQHGSTGVE